jgi:hypothetical protein
MYLPSRLSMGTPMISSEFADYIREWAWKEKYLFPNDLFEPDQPADIYIKHVVLGIFRGIDSSPEAESKLILYSKELESLKAINPYAIITTNYDGLLERLFAN